jgi:hypothetical protein
MLKDIIRFFFLTVEIVTWPYLSINPCPFGLSTTSEQYFSLKQTSQHPAKQTGCLYVQIRSKGIA